MEQEFSNELTFGEAERLAILAEECGEVIQVVGKILRHGYMSYNPTVSEMQQKPNRALLTKELGDLVWIITKMNEATDISFEIPRTNAALEMWIRRKEASASPYLHHQSLTKEIPHADTKP